jgi:hypothetical protein
MGGFFMISVLSRCIATVLLLGLAVDIEAQQSRRPAAQLVSDSLNKELATHEEGEHFAFTSQERSTRTGHHLWVERVVETEQGILRRLISIDGQPLTEEKAKVENRRITNLISRPDEFHNANADNESDEKNQREIILALATAFIFDYDGEDGGCTRINFKPNPAFKPNTYQERILRDLEGTLSVNESQKRICAFDAAVSQRVEIGLGVLGSLEQGGRVHVDRIQTQSGSWQNSVIHIHLVGRMLLVKSISQDIDETRTNIRDVPQHLAPAEAVEFIKP